MRNVLMEIVQDDVNERISSAEVAKEQQTKALDIRNLMNNLKLTLEQAMDALGIPQTDRATYTNLVKGI